MENTSNSELYEPANFQLIFSRKLVFVLLFGAFLLAGNIAHAQLPIFDDFETNFGNWNDGGANCSLLNNNTLLNGNGNVRISNGSDSSNMISNPINLSTYNAIKFDFFFYALGMDNNDNFYVEYDDGTGFAVIANFSRGNEFNNEEVNSVSLTLLASNYTFSTNSRFRIRVDANNDNDRVVFDDINIYEIIVVANDDCSNSVELTPSFLCNPVIGTTENATESQNGCSGDANDDVWYAFRATRSQHTIIVEAGTINDIVLEVFIGGCDGSSLVCENSTSGSSTESATLIGLNVGRLYRFRIYSQSSSISDNGTFSVCVVAPCQPSTALGTDTLACPSVDTGGVGLSGAAVELSCSGGKATLEANYLDLGETTSYDVQAIDFNPPYQFNCLENPISVNVDDVFSDKIELPFNFCFYGNTYDSVVIGSNGVISFDADRLAGTYAGWVIANDIPSTVNSDAGYFGPSIYGVHHDVDPSKGGEIGYQLITLDTGCRALVAAWDEVPMYRDNSILYSGMMVFYEDTNIIDVYIKEKNIDGNNNPWNNGRATVGLQANATEATVPPGRNSLSPNWTATNEAWRFTPSGASITTLNWYADGVLIDSAVNQRQIDVSPTETTTYTAEVTYDLCNSIVPLVDSDDTTVTIIGQKTWNGSQNQAWDNPNNWTPVGVPLSTNCITIPGTGNDPIMTGSVDGNGLNLTVVNGATLIQEPNSTLTIEEDINVNVGGTYNLQNSASLIQIDDTPNIVDGTFTMDRTTIMRSNDYIYWSSPVTNFNIENVSSGTPNGFKYEWSPYVDRTPGPPGTPLNFGEWSSYNTGVMDVGKGYIIKGPTSHPSTQSPFTATFSGNPNNGDIIQPIARGSNFSNDYTYQPYANGDLLLITSDDDNWNLIGNPYPSAINVSDFLSLPANSNIDGFVYLWTHGTDIGTGNADPFYEDYAYNYNVADYIAVNSSGVSDPLGFNGNIGAGQGFFVLMNDLGTSDAMGNGGEIVTFTNSMRSNTYANDQFYRSSDTSDDDSKNRIWLDYISPNGIKNTTLVAYIEGATNDADRMFDALKTKGAGLNLYSLIDDKGYLIQGRQLPFDNNDRVPLGMNITESGIQTIAINTLQGLFDENNNQIFLEDLQTGIIHNLKDSPYTFSSEEDIFEERFVLRYSSDTLGTDDFNTASGIKVFKESDHITIKSSFESIKSVEVFDILGRTIFSDKPVNSIRMTIDTLKPEERVLFLKIVLNDGKQKLAKTIF